MAIVVLVLVVLPYLETLRAEEAVDCMMVRHRALMVVIMAVVVEAVAQMREPVMVVEA
jgi:hypothetical protein